MDGDRTVERCESRHPEHPQVQCAGEKGHKGDHFDALWLSESVKHMALTWPESANGNGVAVGG
jgi:hypothetical protein